MIMGSAFHQSDVPSSMAGTPRTKSNCWLEQGGRLHHEGQAHQTQMRISALGITLKYHIVTTLFRRVCEQNRDSCPKLEIELLVSWMMYTHFNEKQMVNG
jgi:hypothetical protein